jgi:hypothetical protein
MKRPQLQHSTKKLPPSKKLSGHHFGVLTQDDFANVSHGFLTDVDLRTKRGRLMLSSYAQYCEATYAMLCADMENRFSEGDYDESDFAQYAIATRTLSTLIKQIGTRRDTKTINATLDDYLADA